MAERTSHQCLDARAAEHVFVNGEVQPRDKAGHPVLITLVLGWTAGLGCSAGLLIVAAAAYAIPPERWVQGKRRWTAARDE